MDTDYTKYNSYFKNYIDLVPSKDLLVEMERNMIATQELLVSIPSEKGLYAYAKDKWTINELLVHIIDCERVFQYRALCIARNHTSDLPGFDEDDYVVHSNSNQRKLNDIIEEYSIVRKSTIALFKSFNETMINAKGTANGNALTVEMCGYIILGHEIHHRKVLISKYV